MGRRRQGPGLMSQIFDQMFESRAGRIRWMSNMWAIVGSRWDRKRLENPNIANGPRSNEHGNLFGVDRQAVLVKRLCMPHCPCPPADDFYKNPERDFWNVPATECRKCQHHRQPNSRFKFPRCGFEKPERTVDIASQALGDTLGMLAKAMNDAGQAIK